MVIVIVVDVLGACDILQVRGVVVASVSIFVVRLPGILAQRRAEKSIDNHPMDVKMLSTHPW